MSIKILGLKNLEQFDLGISNSRVLEIETCIANAVELQMEVFLGCDERILEVLAMLGKL